MGIRGSFCISLARLSSTSKRAVQGLLSTWPFLNVYLLLGTEGKSPSGPQKDPSCHLLSSFSIVKASVSLPACSCHPA